MKRLKAEKVKRGRIILSAVLTMLTAIISLGFGAYLGYVTLTINYITIGTMTPAVGGLLVVAGFFIFFGCVGGVISLKEIFISSRNEEKFSAYKPALISAMIYYVIIAIISIVGIVTALVSFIPSNYTWSIVGLAIVSLLLCAGAFYLVLKEMKEHKKKSKNKDKEKESEGAIANLNLNPKDIKEFSSLARIDSEKSAEKPSDYEEYLRNSEQKRTGNYGQREHRDIFNHKEIDPLKKEKLYAKYLENDKIEDIDFVLLAERLMQLEELRKAGLINDQEYQTLKGKCI